MTNFISDWLVLTPLREEWGNLIAATPPERDGPWPGAPRTARWRLQRSNDEPLLVAGTWGWVKTPGQTRMAIETARLASALAPRAVALIGIAGTFEPAKLQLGDVVIPYLVYGYTVGTVDDINGRVVRKVRRESAPIAIPLVRAASDFVNGAGYTRWQADCRAHAAALGLTLQAGHPVIHTGEVLASGNEVVRSREFPKQLKDELDERVSCVAMEEIGCAEGLDGAGARASLIVFRGISDHADPDKAELEKTSSDRWRTLAAANAARAWRAMVDDAREPSVQPELQVSLQRGTHAQLDKVFPSLLERVGVQHLVFPDLLKLDTSVPPLSLRVRTTPGTAAEIRLHIEHRTGATQPAGRRAPGGVDFELRELPAGADVALGIRAEPPIEEVQLEVEDYFGRTATAVCHLGTSPPRGPAVAPAGTEVVAENIDHVRLHARLSRVVDPLFETIVSLSGIDRGLLSAPIAPLATRINELVQLAKVDADLAHRLSALLDERAQWTR